MSRRDWWLLVGLPAGLLVLGSLEMAVLRFEGWGAGIACEAVASALLVLRRRHPIVAPTAALLVLDAMPWFGPQLSDPAVPVFYIAVAIYAMARWVPDLRGLIGVAVVLVSVTGVYVLVDSRAHDVSDVAFVLALVTPPYVFGRVVRKLALQGELLRENQELVRREAVRDERDRIARELHDVIAHSISAMVVQTAAAADVVRSDPDTAEALLDNVAGTGRKALSETGRLLHVLRDEQNELGLDPVPGVRQVPDLVESFRANGLEVALDIDPRMAELPVLPAGVDVSVYRIVQEALTNAMRYSADGAAALHLTYRPEALTIRARNAVRAVPGDGPAGEGAGLGLVGIAERVQLLGGRMTRELRDGEFRLALSLPLSPAAEGGPVA
jgi:signal transduction histidine kinase